MITVNDSKTSSFDDNVITISGEGEESIFLNITKKKLFF
jgi:hypothetical protein